MKPDLVSILVCPRCHSSLECQVEERSDEEIFYGSLQCAQGHAYPITHGIPRFVDADRYADTFSKQRLYVRRHFKHYGNDRSGDARFTPSTGIPLAEVNQGLMLEVGCGYGRYLDVVQRHGGQIVGVDLSTHSVDLAYDYVGHKPGVNIVQCDLFSLPFKPATFDRVFSLGVLHHTPSTEQAFKAIVPFAAPGGRISIWVYHPEKKRAADRWRTVTTLLPHPLLYAWCITNQLVFSWIRALPGGYRFSLIIPGAGPGKGRASFWQRVLSDFDNLSPEFAHSHAPREVEKWFRDCGLEDIRVLDFPTAVTGKAPLAEACHFQTPHRTEQLVLSN